MKKTTFFTIGLLVLVLQFSILQSLAQSVSMGSVGTLYCAGDPITVDFTVTGLFDHNNAFTLQLSDAQGSFNSAFRNIGSIIDTLPGTFTISTTLPFDILPSSKYRFRILAAKPFRITSDNGADVSIGVEPPDLSLKFFGKVDDPIEFGLSRIGSQFFVTFEGDATPSNLIFSEGDQKKTVTYASRGLKTGSVLEVSGGCRKTSQFAIEVFDCNDIVIPSNAQVVETDQTIFQDNLVLWVNHGVTIETRSTSDTIFAESGATIIHSGSGGIFYLKPGAVLQPVFGYDIIVKADGSSLVPDAKYSKVFTCPTMTFNYEFAPPNIVVNPSKVASSTRLTLSLGPNPTSHSITVSGLPATASSISLQNILGAKVMDVAAPRSSEATIDLSKLTSGVYYLRVVSAEGVATKKIIRE